VDFSTPFITTPFGIVLRQPDEIEESVSHRLLRVWAPLNPSVWLLIFISFVVTSTVLYVVSYFNPYEWRRMSRDGEATLREGESFTCMNSFWFVMSAMMWQGMYPWLTFYKTERKYRYACDFGVPAMALDEFLLGINYIIPLDGDIPQKKDKNTHH
jgi:hypothetical protein